MKKILIVTYDFPPDALGIQRVAKFCQYLPEFGWQPLVLTVKEKRGIKFKDAIITELETKAVRIFRSGSADPYRVSYVLKKFFTSSKKKSGEGFRQASGLTKKIAEFLRRWVFIPDDRMPWIPFALAKALKIISREKPEVVLTTSYPSSAHLIGLAIKKMKGIKWVADFRDGWLQNPVFYRPPTILHLWLQRKLERTVAKNADLLIGISEPIVRYFSHLSADNEKCLTITNGFDEEDFRKVEAKVIEPEGRMILLYTGTLFAPRRADSLLLGLKLLLEEKPALKEKILLLFLSALDEKTLNLINELSLKAVVKIEGLKPYKECIAYQKGADVLVLIINPEENAEIMMTQKVFDYLASGRAILGIMPESPCKSLLRTLKAGKIVPYGDVAAIKNAIAEFFSEWSKGSLAGVPMNALQQFTRRNITEKLALALNKLIRESE